MNENKFKDKIILLISEFEVMKKRSNLLIISFYSKDIKRKLSY